MLDRATGIDPAAMRIHLSNRPPLAYDLCSIDIGIGSGLPGVPGADDHAVAAKPLGAYAEAWEAFLARRPETPHLVIVGAGVGGVELALASAHRLKGQGAKPQITLIDRAATALPQIGPAARARLMGELDRAGIAFRPGCDLARIEAASVTLTTGETLRSDFTLLVAGGQPQPWLAESGLATRDGLLAVGPTLQTSDPAILAAGDCAHLSHAPRPKALPAIDPGRCTGCGWCVCFPTMTSDQVLFCGSAYGELGAAVCSAAGLGPGELERKLFPDGERYQRFVTPVRGATWCCWAAPSRTRPRWSCMISAARR